MNKFSIIILLLSLLPLETFAENDDFGLWTSIEATKKINSELSVGIEGELRTKNNLENVDSWGIEMGMSYKFTKWLKASAGYTFLYYFYDSETKYKKSGKLNKYIPSYWQASHRFYASVTGSIKLGQFDLSLRERWQYKYRPEKTIQQWDYDEEEYIDRLVGNTGKHALRSRLAIEYDIPKCILQPYASIELYNNWSIYKIKYAIGTEIKTSKNSNIKLYYLHQHLTDEDEVNQNIIGLSYNIKL